MAKIKQCAFCGAEVTTGLFKGTAKELELTQTIVCCPDCYAAISEEIKDDQERIVTKIENFKSAAKAKLTDADIVTLVRNYLEEAKQFKEKNGREIPTEYYGFFHYNANGFFSVQEFGLGKSDVTGGAMVASALKSQLCDTTLFTKADITKLEYKFASAFGFARLFASRGC